MPRDGHVDVAQSGKLQVPRRRSRKRYSGVGRHFLYPGQEEPAFKCGQYRTELGRDDLEAREIQNFDLARDQLLRGGYGHTLQPA